MVKQDESRSIDEWGCLSPELEFPKFMDCSVADAIVTCLYYNGYAALVAFLDAKIKTFVSKTETPPSPYEYDLVIMREDNKVTLTSWTDLVD